MSPEESHSHSHGHTHCPQCDGGDLIRVHLQKWLRPLRLLGLRLRRFRCADCGRVFVRYG